MIRLETPVPAEWFATWNQDQLRSEARSALGALDVNERDTDDGPMAAVYVPDDSTVTEEQWAALVAAHVPAPDPVDPDPLAIFDAGITGTLTVAKLKNAIRAVLVAQVAE